MKIQAVDQRKIGKILVANLEEIAGGEILIGSVEIPTNARKLCLDLAFDASIFDDVDERQVSSDVLIAESTHLLAPLVGGRPESMGDFVTDQHIVQGVIHVLPDRESQDAGLRIERSGLCVCTMLDCNILGCHQASEDVLGSGFYVGFCVIHRVHYSTNMGPDGGLYGNSTVISQLRTSLNGGSGRYQQNVP